MGPRPRGRGIAHAGHSRTAGGLQWGRDRAVAELWQMRSFGVQCASHASMGPRPRGRGIDVGSPERNRLSGLSLQWGRDRAVAELPSTTPSQMRSESVASMGPRPRGRGISPPTILFCFQRPAQPAASGPARPAAVRRRPRSYVAASYSNPSHLSLASGPRVFSAVRPLATVIA